MVGFSFFLSSFSSFLISCMERHHHLYLLELFSQMCRQNLFSMRARCVRRYFLLRTSRIHSYLCTLHWVFLSFSLFYIFRLVFFSLGLLCCMVSRDISFFCQPTKRFENENTTTVVNKETVISDEQRYYAHGCGGVKVEYLCHRLTRWPDPRFCLAEKHRLDRTCFCDSMPSPHVPQLRFYTRWASMYNISLFPSRHTGAFVQRSRRKGEFSAYQISVLIRQRLITIGTAICLNNILCPTALRLRSRLEREPWNCLEHPRWSEEICKNACRNALQHNEIFSHLHPR